MVVNKTSKIGSIVFKIIFFCVFSFSLIIGIVLSCNVNSISEAASVSFIENWTVIDQGGNSIETGRTYSDDRAYSEDFTIISRMPEIKRRTASSAL